MVKAQEPVCDDPVDPDVGVRPPARRRTPLNGQGAVVAVVSLGGVLGACARYGASLLWPTPSGGFPWTTLAVNSLGCAVIGVFMVLISEVWAAHRLVRPFFGTGVLGGFTTFSTYAVEIQRLITDGRARTGLAYLALTVVTALVSVTLAATVTRRLVVGRQK
ncbi:fluoride efflux transporter CrcB [Streptomyces catenulae]|uniref:Fluoride-specific ion channel FluC n=1 Tax=Streptomyces catenulae TaxID=66875 RepID=A0ABV2YVX1_9ACTN|nr:fluoride efflux transporter CrcB [Streptomyces catenulae]